MKKCRYHFWKYMSDFFQFRLWNDHPSSPPWMYTKPSHREADIIYLICLMCQHTSCWVVAAQFFNNLLNNTSCWVVDAQFFNNLLNIVCFEGNVPRLLLSYIVICLLKNLFFVLGFTFIKNQRIQHGCIFIKSAHFFYKAGRTFFFFQFRLCFKNLGIPTSKMKRVLFVKALVLLNLWDSQFPPLGVSSWVRPLGIDLGLI